MNLTRRGFVKNMTTGSVGIALGIPVILKKNIVANDMVIFPFFKYLKEYNIGDFIPKDQGGKFIQMELIKSESDEAIVEKIRGGLLEEIYGNPVNWGILEKTELEKSVWLNRFYYLPSFARLYYLTGDKSHLSFMMQFISKWIAENPRVAENKQSKYNWFDMQVAWRAIHLSWCYFLTHKGLSKEDKTVIIDSLKEHAAILLSGFGKQPLNEFNHQSHGALAMLYLGVLFPSFESAHELRQSALRIIGHHLEKAFYNDGGNVEQMFGYYPFETHLFRDTYLLCSQNNIEWPPQLLPMLEKMALYLSTVAQPDGTMPPVNDSYEMTAVPMLTVLNEILDKRVDIHSKTSIYFPETQIGILRGEDSKNKWYILANPAKSIGAHAHAGRLAFTLWYNEQPVLVDSGCCNYDNPQLVKWYRTTKAHNTVLIDGKSDEATSTDRLWAPKRITENRITDWLEGDLYTCCRMVSPASETVNSSVTWNRSLALVKNQFLVLHDCFESKEEHNYELLFHFPPVSVTVNDNSKAIRVFDKNPMAIFPAYKKLIDDLTISEGLVSIKGKDTPSPMATFRFKGKGTVHSVIVFIPQADDLSQIKIRQKNTDNGIGVTITTEKSRKTVLLMRNPESKELSVFGRRTRNLFEVF